MSHRYLKWLLAELPRLVAQKFITVDQQDAILEYYRDKLGQRPNIALIAFSIIGSVLLSSGIILILAHNWGNIPRFVRTGIAYFPLLVGQGFGFWVIQKRRESVAWKEGVASFTFLALGSTLGLISQTYHIQGELSHFLLTWMLLGLPLAYLFRSITSSVFYIVGISIWAMLSIESGAVAHKYWVFLALIFPIFWVELQTPHRLKPATILGWLIGFSLIVGGLVALQDITEGFRIIVFISLFIALYATGSLQTSNLHSLWMQPFYRIGAIGLPVVYLILSSHRNWRYLSYSAATSIGRGGEIIWIDYVVSIGLPVLATWLTILTIRRKHPAVLGMYLGLPLALLGFAISNYSAGPGIIALLFNLYVFGGGVAFLIWGIRKNSSGMLNFGFVLVSTVIVLRFFDSRLSFVLRGVIFVLLGAGFLAANLVIARRKAVR